jgi:hypothetical protein
LLLASPAIVVTALPRMRTMAIILLRDIAQQAGIQARLSAAS